MTAFEILRHQEAFSLAWQLRQAGGLQCHPHLPVLATSGIESIVRLWSPEGPADMSDFSAAIQSNQQRMQDGPQLLRGINPAVIQVRPGMGGY